jgi:hypothetical protein
MLQKQFVVLLGLVFGLGALSACSNQVAPAPVSPETPTAGPATASLAETAAMPEAEATIEQPAPEVSQPATELEEATTTPDGQSGEMVDEMGRYRLETIVPARYPGCPPHIHVKVNAPGGLVLTTQIYFEGQPGNG